MASIANDPGRPATSRVLNRWNIPPWLEEEVLARDRRCVYCGVSFSSAPKKPGECPSWEHIINDASLITRKNIARCCISCNSSKGTKDLAVWIASQYCVSRGINIDSVAPVIKDALAATKAET